MANGNKEYSDLQEKQIAAYLGWKQVSGSGSRPNHPGDVVSDSWLGECKTHTHPGHNLIFNFNVWNKIKEEASSQFKEPVLFVDDGSQLLSNTYCMIPVARDFIIPGSEDADYSDKASISLKLDEITDGFFAQINSDICCIMSIKKFKEFLEYS